MAANGLAAIPDSPFAKAEIVSVPPAAAFRGQVPDASRLLVQIPPQLLRSWYIMYFQLPWLPERSGFRVVPRLWRRWSPGYDAKEDLRHVDAAIGTPENWRAALGTYRATIRNTRPPARYRELHGQWMSRPRVPSLYLHGRDDGCMTSAFAHWVSMVLPDGSDVAVVDHAGHFLQLDQPQQVADLVLDHIGSAG